MNSKLLSDEIQSYIREHEHVDAKKLLLKYRSIQGIPASTIAQQIIGRQKAKEKLPLFYETHNIIYPPGINLEQSSSEATAQYKKDFIFEGIESPGCIADLTGGLGVDSYFFDQIFSKVFFIEPDVELLEIVKHNHRQLGAKNITYFPSTAEAFLEQFHQPLDCFYIDPSRRREGNRKVFSFADCAPDVTSLQPRLFQLTRFVVVKASPLLDIKQGISDLQFVKRVVVLSVQNECKELLFVCERDHWGEPLIQAVNVLKGKNPQLVQFRHSDEREAIVTYSEPLSYLYEPNASLLKAGAFKIISDRYNLLKLHPNTHLYTSDTLVRDFPGNTFRVIAQPKASKKVVNEFFSEGKAIVTTRNYPLSVSELRKKTGLKEGGEKYLIGCSSQSKKHLIVAEKIIIEKPGPD